MYSYLQGKIINKTPTELVLDVNGVGFLLNISIHTFEKLNSSANLVKVYTYLFVREDALQLYGFATEAEREMFKMLISVSGIGPRIAQSILSGIEPEQLKAAFKTGDTEMLTSIPGVGRKTAERLILELRDKFEKAQLEIATQAISQQHLKIWNECLNALISLGYNKSIAQQAIRKVFKEVGNKELTLEELIKQALFHAGKY